MRDRKTTLTKTWVKADGTRVPLPIMSDEYLKNAYRRCVEIIFGNHVIKVDGGSRDAYKREAPIDIQTATKWKDIFEDEAKKRNVRLPKINKETYSHRIGKVLVTKKYQMQRNKRFDEMFN